MSNNGGTCFDPLFYLFPKDDKLYDEIESTFLFSGALKVTPSLTNTTTESTVPSYFPDAKGKWVSLTNLSDFKQGNKEYDLDIT